MEPELLELELEDLLQTADSKFKKSIQAANEKLATLRVGRASASMLDRVQVDYYGAQTPLQQLASVSTPSATLIVVDVYDKACLADVEKALMNSDLGMTPSNDGSIIRLNVPPMTADKRKEMAKVARSIGEEGKVAMRNVRRDAMDKIKKLQKNEGLSEDLSKGTQEDLDKKVKTFESELQTNVDTREKEILTL